MSVDDILLEISEGIGTITLNRPRQLNAMTTAGFTALLDALDGVASDDSVRVVVLTGAGRGFCAGGDLNNMANVDPRPEEEAQQELRELTRVSELLRGMGKLTIAAVNGPCAGAGFSIACAADLRYAAESAVFKTAYLDAGLSGDFGGTWTLPRLVGDAAAREMYLLCGRVTATDALRLGLVTAVVPDDELLGVVREVARAGSRRAPAAVRGIKENLDSAWRLPLEEALSSEARRHVTCGRTQDAAEAAQAFVERRQPVFTGR